MRQPLLMTLTFAFVLIAAACSSSPPGTPGPATPVTSPGAAPPAPVVTPAPVATPPAGNIGTGTECAATPSFDITNPVPSFAPDLDLEARFPTQIDGQPVTELQSVRWVELICLYGGQAGVDQFKADLPGGGSLNFATLTFASAVATVDGDDVQLSAFRTPGLDANVMVQAFAQLAGAISGETTVTGTLSNVTLGGKNVSVWTDEDGTINYLYASGDVLFGVSDVTDSQANKIFAALP